MERLVELRDIDAVPARVMPRPKPFPARGGVLFPADAPDWCQHMRRDRVMRAPPPIDPRPSNPRHLPGTYVYCGFVHHHFGHQVGEFMHRLWPLERPEYRNATPVFFPLAPHMSESLTRNILSLMRLPEPLFIHEPVRFERLVVGETAKILGRRPMSDYNRFLESRLGYLRNSAGPFPSRLAVLRGHRNSGRCLGEPWLEQKLVEAGYVAFHPEDHDLQSQIEHYLSAERIIFAEGSAIHLIDILPPLRAEVAVITRRDRLLGEKSLTDKCAKLFFVDGLFLGHPTSNPGIRPRGLAWLDVGRCLEALASWGFIDTAPAGDPFDEPETLADDLISYMRANPSRPGLRHASDEVLLRDGLAFLMRGMRSVIRERLVATPPPTVRDLNDAAGEREQRAARREAERAQRVAERDKRLMERERRLAERAALGRSPGRPQQHAKPELA